MVLEDSHHVVIRSASGDTDILILAIPLLYQLKLRIKNDSVSAKKRINVWLVIIELTEEYCLELVGIYAFSGNYYISLEKMLEDY